MVDDAVLAAKIAAVSDAVQRIRDVLPPTVERFRSDRTAREVVTLNLFVALQECLALAAHWLADARWTVPASYGDVFIALADHGVIDRDLATRLMAAAGLRNLIAHLYGAIDFDRIYAIASEDLGDLLTFCRVIAGRSGERL
jgi:uncharacterized protein YutE (UPF0331/DUF86 family)